MKEGDDFWAEPAKHIRDAVRRQPASELKEVILKGLEAARGVASQPDGYHITPSALGGRAPPAQTLHEPGKKKEKARGAKLRGQAK